MKKYILTPVEDQNAQVSESQQRNGITNEEILQCMPKNIKNKASLLLNTINRSKNLEWNSKGEIVIAGEEPIPGSHIIDLIKFTLFPYKHFIPIGLEQFQQSLQNINIPQSLLIQKGRGLPPPGIPANTKPRPAVEKAWTWHKL